jgi:hypothetical protein
MVHVVLVNASVAQQVALEATCNIALAYEAIILTFANHIGDMYLAALSFDIRIKLCCYTRAMILVILKLFL